MNECKIELGSALPVLERIAAALEKLTGAAAPVPCPAVGAKITKAGDIIPIAAEPAEAPTVPEVAPPAEPEVTLDAIRQMVVRLSAAGQKDAVRQIVTAYASSVSGIPAGAYPEVWAKLQEVQA